MHGVCICACRPIPNTLQPTKLDKRDSVMLPASSIARAESRFMSVTTKHRGDLSRLVSYDAGLIEHSTRTSPTSGRRSTQTYLGRQSTIRSDDRRSSTRTTKHPYITLDDPTDDEPVPHNAYARGSTTVRDTGTTYGLNFVRPSSQQQEASSGSRTAPKRRQSVHFFFGPNGPQTAEVDMQDFESPFITSLGADFMDMSSQMSAATRGQQRAVASQRSSAYGLSSTPGLNSAAGLNSADGLNSAAGAGAVVGRTSTAGLSSAAASQTPAAGPSGTAGRGSGAEQNTDRGSVLDSASGRPGIGSKGVPQ